MLKQQAMGNMFREMAQRMANMTPEEMQRLKEMLADLNHMMDQQVWGEQPNFEGFMQKYGDMFGPNPAAESRRIGAATRLPGWPDAIPLQQPSR